MRSEPWGRPVFAAQGPAIGKEGWLRGSAQGSRRVREGGLLTKVSMGSWLLAFTLSRWGAIGNSRAEK